jgi:hypothetical protein
MRLYAFAGEKFRTLWAPENIWGEFSVQVTPDGFRVDGDYYRGNRRRHARYSVDEEGIYLAR